MTSLKRPKLSGRCVYCKQAYTLATIGRHLISCEKRSGQVSKVRTHKTFILSIKGEGVTGYAYWMLAEVNPRLMLLDLDTFLRRRWVECCGHLSQFIIKSE